MSKPVATSRVERSPRPAAVGFWAGLHVALISILLALAIGQARAGTLSEPQVAELALGAFGETCTVRGMTADRAEARMRAHVAARGGTGLPFDLAFYDITIEPTDLTVTPGTDRRCEVAFPGDHTGRAVETLLALMATPPVFGQPIPLPVTHSPHPGTSFIEGRQLNPRVAAVVHVGTRVAETGLETFINVERLLPSDDQ